MRFIVYILLALTLPTFVAGQDSLGSKEDRFKADLLLVVAHPDDESVAGSYLARAIFDQHKRVAVVFGTRGNSGGDEVGPEQAAALGAVREIEGRKALAYFGVSNVWFLDAPDTPGQDVLRSLETWDHGRSLERLVRYIRLTRPEVIVTWLPDYVAGENHGDHQAAGVLATEAFDLAGDPTVFAEQVTAPRNARDISNLSEGLHPWQPKKLYYVTDGMHTEFMRGQGPQYSATDLSPSKQVTYERLAAESCAFHLTQSDSGYAAARALTNNTVEKTYLHEPAQFALGKSYVGADKTSDLFAGIAAEPVPYRAAPSFQPEPELRPKFELGGPWHFYSQFWKTHGIDQLAQLVPPEVAAGVSTPVAIPLLIENPGKQALEGTLKVNLPSGWTLRPGATSFEVPAGGQFSGRVIAVAPAAVDGNWRPIKISAEAGGASLGEVSVRVQVVNSSLPQ